MKRRGFTLALTLMFLCCLFGCQKNEEVNIRQMQTSRLQRAATVSELQENSDLIVVVTPKSQENILSYYSDGNIAFGYTKTAVVVSEVLKGDVSIDDTIWVTEECYTTDNGSVLWTQQGYLPMQIDERYLLFLTRYSDKKTDYAGMYYPTELEYGKYLLGNREGGTTFHSSTATEENLQIGPGGDLEKYSSWREQVVSLYPNIFKNGLQES